jgi:hypothetical protein
MENDGICDGNVCEEKRKPMETSEENGKTSWKSRVI